MGTLKLCQPLCFRRRADPALTVRSVMPPRFAYRATPLRLLAFGVGYNTASGLFGIGIIESDYKFDLRKHDCGDTEAEQFYPHFRDVRWIYTTYAPRTSLFSKGEKGGWQPFGTVNLYDEIPPYVARLIAKVVPS